eukprot:gene24285-biopygen7385
MRASPRRRRRRVWRRRRHHRRRRRRNAHNKPGKVQNTRNVCMCGIATWTGHHFGTELDHCFVNSLYTGDMYMLYWTVGVVALPDAGHGPSVYGQPTRGGRTGEDWIVYIGIHVQDRVRTGNVR